MNIKHLIYIISFFVPLCVSAHGGEYKPIEFVQNKGQWDGAFEYKTTTSNGDIYLERNAINIVVGHRDNIDLIRKHKAGPNTKKTLKFHRYRMVFVGANTDINIVGDKAQPHYYNYFLGNDSSKWQSNIHPNLAVDYTNLYDGIDLHISSDAGKLKYDFIISPGSDAAKIEIEYDGIERLKTEKGNLIVTTSVGEAIEMEPYAFQYKNGERIQVKCKYKVSGNKLSYYFPQDYDHNLPLIIDPTVVFATFSGSSYDNWGFTATYDNQGNFYAGGIVSNAQGGSGFNVTTGAYDVTFGGGSNLTGSRYPCDMSIAKYNAAGTSLIYATYLGGTDNEQPHSLIVDGNNNLVICGRSYSTDYPRTNGCYDNSHNGGGDIVLSILNAAGSNLNASTYIGGTGDDVVNFDAEEFVAGNLKHNYGDDARSEVILDNSGNVYVAACTKSTDFPTTGNAHQSGLAGGTGQDGVVFKMNANLSSLIYSTYIGGTSDDAAYVLALNKSQNQLFVAGGTMGGGFPTTAGTLHQTARGGIDGFILRFENGGAYTLQRGTYIGTNNYDQCYGIQLNDQDEVYVMGQTLGGGFPVTAGVYSVANSSQFVMKLDNNLSTNLISTVYGSGNSNVTNISPVAFLVDTCENVYISGWGGDIYTSAGATLPPGVGNTQNMPLSSAAGPNPPAQGSTDGRDFYFIVFSKNLSSLLYGTYYGGTSATPEHVDGGTSRFDKTGVVYQAICGGCSEGSAAVFPTTPGVYSTTNKSTNCNLIALKIAFNLGAVNAKAAAVPNAIICLGEPVNFSSGGSANATSYEWDFGDGNTSASASPTHTYGSGGSYQVRLVAVNPNACKTRDTTFLTVTVDSNAMDADFELVTTDSCKPFRASINNTSKAGTAPGPTTYEWDYGDGNKFSGANPGTHEYKDTGTYTIRLIMINPNACNSPDTVSKIVSFNTVYVEAGFGAPEKLCEKTKAVFNNLSTNAATYLWSFGDGNTSTDQNPEHTYDTAGTYTVKLVVYNPLTCNRADSAEKTIFVEGTPIALFRHMPIIPVTNEPIEFTNQSRDAINYVWDFGDNTFSQLETPEPKFYKRTGTYKVCLQASNLVGCSDTICRSVDSDVYPLADLPKAFSPNGDGSNDILYVRGAGIESIDLKIYNRWGEVVFETTDIKTGWDGKFKGKEQPVEAYGYVLNVTFVDETTFYKRGNVTLLR